MAGVNSFDLHMGGSESMVTRAPVRGSLGVLRAGDGPAGSQRPQKLVGWPYLGRQRKALHLFVAGLSNRKHVVQHGSGEARGDPLLQRSAQSQVVRQNRLSRPAHARVWHLDLVLSLEAQRGGIFEKVGGPKNVP